MDLILKHVINSLIDLVKHPSQSLLSLVPLLTLLVKLFVELTDFLIEHVHKNLTCVLSLLVLFQNRSVYLVDLLSKGALIPVMALLSSFFFLG